MKFPTHKKQSYHAQCIELNENNYEEVIAVLVSTGARCEMYRGYLMMRRNGHIHALSVGHWVARGENGEVKCYDGPTFKIKYEEI